MTTKKKAARRLAPSSGRVQGFGRGTTSMFIISNPRQNASPNLDRGGGFPVSFGMLLAWIGAAGLVRQLARLIEWMERG